MDETKLTAALPNLDIQILHRALPDDGAEAISITVKATPSFDAVAAQFLPSLMGAALGPLPLALPFGPGGLSGSGTAASMAGVWLAPLRMWTDMAHRFWAPWLALASLRRDGEP